MPARTADLLEHLGRALGALPGVFSTPQWGGRAWKLPGPGGNRRKPRLVAFVGCTREGAVAVSFKLAPGRAADVVARNAWVRPHDFRTLAPSGWLTARVTTARQASSLVKLLQECRRLHGDEPEQTAEKAATRGGPPAASHLDRVMGAMRERGWSPPQRDGFDD